MSSKPSDNDERYKTLGFESTFDGSTGGVQWSELVDDLKTNLLRRSLVARSSTCDPGPGVPAGDLPLPTPAQITSDFGFYFHKAYFCA